MILYEFKCDKCMTVFEELVKSDADDVVCPRCGSAEVERVLSAVKSKSDSPPGQVGAGGSGCGPSSGFS